METKEKIVGIIAEYKGIDASDVSTDKSFADLGLDSLDVAELAMQIEDACGCEIDITPELNTIDKLVAYIEAK